MQMIIIRRVWWLVLIAAIMAVCSLGVSLGVNNIATAAAQLEAMQKANLRLDRENRALYRIVQNLKQDGNALGKICQTELGLIRPDEVVYIKP